MIALGVMLIGTVAAQQAPLQPADTRHDASVSQTKAEAEPAVADESGKADSGFKSRKEKLSYALAVDFARNLRWQRIDVDVDLMTNALRDALTGSKLRMTNDEVTATLKTFEQEQKQDYEHAKSMISEKNRRATEAFVAENVKKEGVVTLPSGLQFKVLRLGGGKVPTLDDQVVCNYRGTLLDGTEFDSSYKRNQPATLPVKGLIKGWSEALQLMTVGSKWQLFIPPQLAYGEKIVGGIGPNAMLIFEVELLSIEDKPQTATAAK
jgi:FKBP-type peptidyl-prolyl cis-trans isomerase FklB